MDADIDRLMGERTAARPVASGRVPAPRALEFGLVLMASRSRYSPRRSTCSPLPSPCSGPLLRRRLHGIPEGLDRPEHRDRRSCRGSAAARRLRRSHRHSDAARTVVVPDRVPLDPPHFWALALMIKEHYAGRERADAPGTRAIARRRGRSCSTRSCWSAFTVAVGWWLGPVYTALRISSARISSSSRGSSAATRRAAGRCCSSTTLSRTLPCCSWQRRSTRWSPR